MKVYFTCSTAEFTKYKDTYFAIRTFLINSGHTLTRDWLPHTAKRIKQQNTQLRDITQIYKACMQAIGNADVVIIEDTVTNFSTGHQITKALQMRKPTLVLWQGRKHREFEQMFIHGINSDLLEIAEYRNVDDLQEILTIFLNKYEKITERHRFHLVLNDLERTYLDWASYKYKTSRTKLIRGALRSKIDQDQQFRDYLKTK